jgi:hypothetical protein
MPLSGGSGRKCRLRNHVGDQLIRGRLDRTVADKCTTVPSLGAAGWASALPMKSASNAVPMTGVLTNNMVDPSSQ